MRRLSRSLPKAKVRPPRFAYEIVALVMETAAGLSSLEEIRDIERAVHGAVTFARATQILGRVGPGPLGSAIADVRFRAG